MRRILVSLITLLVIFLLTGRSSAQSNVHSQEQRGVFAQMDPALEGYWEGHAGAKDGMKYDPIAIACMLSKCSRVRNENSADPNQLRDSRNFQTCYAAHLARVQSGYVRLASPPPISVLGCNLIAAQAKSTDDRVYAAVNGRPRVQPTATTRVAKSRRARVSGDEEAYLLAQVSRPLADPDAGADDNPYKDDPPKAAPKPSKAQPKAPPRRVRVWNDNPYVDDSSPKAAPKPSPAQPKLALKPTVKPTAPKAEPPRTSAMASDNPYVDDESKDKLVLVSANDREAVIYVKPGGQFYAIRASYLAKKYNTDWKAVYTNAANQYADFIGSCWKGNKVRLDPDRMNAKSYDKAKLDGPVDDKFMKSCDGEFNFALQAGRTITLPIKGHVIAQALPKEPDQSPAEKPKQAQANESPPPAPSGSAPMDSIEVPLEPPALVAGVVASSATPPEVSSAPADSVAALSAGKRPPPSDSATISVTANGKKRVTSVNWNALGLWFKGWPSTVVAFSLLAGFIAIYELYRRKRFRNKVGHDPPPTGCGAESDPFPPDADHGEIHRPPPREVVKDLKQRVIVRLDGSSPDEATVPTRLK